MKTSHLLTGCKPVEITDLSPSLLEKLGLSLEPQTAGEGYSHTDTDNLQLMLRNNGGFQDCFQAFLLKIWNLNYLESNIKAKRGKNIATLTSTYRADVMS